MRRRFLTSVLISVVAAVSAAFAQTPLQPVQIVPATTPLAGRAVPSFVGHALTREDLEPWLDGIVPYALQSGDVAGAVVVVVKDGKVLLQKGYGYSNVLAKASVSPDLTLFRTGSIGKLFTWTAVMQLVEQHKLNLDRDINDYLDFKIPLAFEKPITLRNLIQHTAGFEDHGKYGFVGNTRDQVPIGDYLKHNMPARLFAPGEYPAYSNYGTTLAGYIVQRVSGEPYAQYVQRHIFTPLGMEHSSLQQPLPLNLAGDMSKGYRVASGPPEKFELVNIAPAGGGSNTGADMARFMLAHLNKGQLGGVRILQPATAALMHRQSYQATPPLPGFALGFYHEDRNGHQVIAHEGDTNLFHSDLELFLDDGVGFFIAVNSLGKDGAGGTVRSAVFNNFANRYFPAPPTGPEPTMANARHDGAVLAGNYRETRRIQNTLLDFVYLLGQKRIAMAEDGTLTVSGFQTIGGATKRWREVGPFLWRDIDGHDRMAARVENGMVKAVWFDETVPAFVLQPVPKLHDRSWILPLLGVSLTVLLLAAVSWPFGALARRQYGQPFPYGGSRARAYRLVRAASLINLVFTVGMITTLISMAGNALFLDGSNDWIFRVFQAFGLVGLLGIVIGPWNLVQVWQDRTARWWAKAGSAAIAVALIVVPVLGVTLHLLTASLNY